jgi:hypothetical protein
MTSIRDTIEARRLAEPALWRRWGPYLSDRSWGTVREDDSSDGNAWRYFPHDQARSRAYRWGEDGIAGISDEDQLLCLGLAFWNGKDPILKERFFGLDNTEGNHGEDPKDYWFHLDATPSHSLLRMAYRYPQAAFPYQHLADTNRGRPRHEPEYELVDTGVFAEGRWFDIEMTYAKADHDDIVLTVTVRNRGPEAAELHVLPQLWFRNTWSWGEERSLPGDKPRFSAVGGGSSLRAEHAQLGTWLCSAAPGPGGAPELLFTDNDTNEQLLFNRPNASPYTKDAFHEAVVAGRREALRSDGQGTKAAFHYRLQLPPGGTATLRLRLHADRHHAGAPQDDAVLQRCQADADAFYSALQPAALDEDTRRIQRQAWAGMIWSKQWFAYSVPAWQRQTTPDIKPGAHFRNHAWHHFDAADIISMPDAWEYPWFAAWDLGFHCIALAYIDPRFAKDQLLLMVSERYQHPNGAIAAYEWNFDDVNPPVLARAALRVYEIEHRSWGVADREFLEIMFQKLALNFAWWVNRKDSQGRNLFGGGFLGLDNIGVFDRSKPLPTGGELEQSDGTAWMATFACDMTMIAFELAEERPLYRKLALKYAIHFLYVASSMNNLSGNGSDLWDEQDGFYYDLLRVENRVVPLRIRSMVGLIPLFATFLQSESARDEELAAWLADFCRHRPELARVLATSRSGHGTDVRIHALVERHRSERILRRMLDPAEFLSDFGIRALSKIHEREPYSFQVGAESWQVRYVPAESDSGMFGGNSNWRGPIWMPVNYFLVTALRRMHRAYGDSFTVEHPVGSGQQRHLGQVADDLSRRLVAIFARDAQGRRPVNGGVELFDQDPSWRDCVPFYEYFHGDTGRGVGASHQTGWTGLIAALIQEMHGADAVVVSGD